MLVRMVHGPGTVRGYPWPIARGASRWCLSWGNDVLSGVVLLRSSWSDWVRGLDDLMNYSHSGWTVVSPAVVVQDDDKRV